MDKNQAFLDEEEVEMLYDGLMQLEAGGYSTESLVTACKRYIEEKEEKTHDPENRTFTI